MSVPRVTGLWWDEIHEREPDGSLRLVRITPKRHNDRMDSFWLLVARLLKNDGDLVARGGILQHAQGVGDEDWEDPDIPEIDVTDTALVSEAGRKAPASIVYLDEDDLPSDEPTLKLRITTIYLEDELADTVIREQALFGGDATSVVDSGIMLNGIRHDPLPKGGGQVLTRKVDLTLGP